MSQERRDFPRIETEHSVELVDEDGSAFPTLALDLSLAGMQMLCDQPTAERIAPGGNIDACEGKSREFDVRLRIWLRDQSRHRLRIRCRLMTLREIQTDEYRIGMKFIGFEGDSYQILEAYVDESLPD